LDSPAPPPHHAWLKLAILVLVVAALGLPINDLVRYAMLTIAAVLIVAGEVTARAPRWLAALAAVGLCVAGQILLMAPRIEEGHNIFIVDGERGSALAAGLPAEVFALMRAEFDAKYPPSRRCDPSVAGCWRGEGFPSRTFALSADALYDHATYSRRVAGIDFADPVWLRLGFINERGYNWITPPSDLNRAVRDRRSLALLHRWQLTMPWFVMYQFPAAFVGSELCWRGEVLWEQSPGRFEAISHSEMACRTLTAADMDKSVFGVAIANDPPLAMRLVPTTGMRLRQLIEPALALLGSAAVLALLVTWRWRRIVLPFAAIAVTLLLVVLDDLTLIGGVRPYEGGDDGLVYEGFARIMLTRLAAGDIAGALQGGESVFYFTPGMRYLRVIEHLIFGDTALGYLSLMLLLPFLVFALFRRFLPLRWALAIVTMFVVTPVGVLFGSSLMQYVKWAARGYADPAAFVLFLAGTVLLVGRTASGVRNRFGGAAAAGLLLALAVFARPNLAPAAGILVAGSGLAAIWQAQYRRVVGLGLGFLPVLGMALHNWIYGHELVLFTSTIGITMSMPPDAYAAALRELLAGDVAGTHVMAALRQVGAWLAGPSELVFVAPIHAAALLVLARMVMARAADPWLRLIAGAILLQQGVGLFFFTAGRYYYLTWLLTLLVVVVWVNGEGLALLRRHWPRLCERAAKHSASIAIMRGLDRMAAMS
jgi:hypothetical protein